LIEGNSCHVLTVTEKCPTEESLLKKPVIIVTARVHPGESNASWIMSVTMFNVAIVIH
jgi:hypothetical protein